MIKSEYKGEFINTEPVTINANQAYWLIKNKEGDSYYDLRDGIRPKYVLITEIEPPYRINGLDELGFFSFEAPLKVYFLDDVPDHVLNNYINYSYDGKNFKEIINVELWRYNEMHWSSAQIDEIEDGGGNAAHLRQYRAVVRSYAGDGVNPPFPERVSVEAVR